jgi:hypothetical protein
MGRIPPTLTFFTLEDAKKMTETDHQIHLKAGDMLTGWVSPSVEMRASEIAGHGMFALRAILPGEAVVRWGGTLYTRAQIMAGLADPESIALIDEDLYLADPVGAPAPEDYSMNHSCDPNVWMAGAFTLTARRRIEPGEEITADYALWLYDVDWTLETCQCGSPLCRGRVSGADWRLPELQARYAGHFTPYILRRIESGG